LTINPTEKYQLNAFRFSGSLTDQPFFHRVYVFHYPDFFHAIHWEMKSFCLQPCPLKTEKLSVMESFSDVKSGQ